MSTLKDSVLRGLGVQSYSYRPRQGRSWGGGGRCGRRRDEDTTFSARAQHGLMGKALYLWVTPFLKLGGERTLQMEDLPPLPPGYLASNNSRRFEDALARAMEGEEARLQSAREWAEVGKKPKDPFLPAVVWPSGAASAPPSSRGSPSSSSTTSYSSSPWWCSAKSGRLHRRQEPLPHLLRPLRRRLRHHLLRPHVPRSRLAHALRAGVFLLRTGERHLHQGRAGHTFTVRRCDLSAAGRDGATIGEVLNHMQLDAQRVGDLMLFINVLWSGILQTLGYMALLHAYIGWASVGGFMVMVILVPMQKWFFQIISKLRNEQMKLTDRRVKLQNEALSGVKILKLNAWEEPLRTEVEGVRAEEMVKAKGVANRNAMNTAIMNTGPTLVAVAAFSIYSGIMRKPMTPDVIFPSITFFNLLRFPGDVLPALPQPQRRRHRWVLSIYCRNTSSSRRRTPPPSSFPFAWTTRGTPTQRRRRASERPRRAPAPRTPLGGCLRRRDGVGALPRGNPGDRRGGQPRTTLSWRTRRCCVRRRPASPQTFPQ